jgi:hypothetical protein
VGEHPCRYQDLVRIDITCVSKGYKSPDCGKKEGLKTCEKQENLKITKIFRKNKDYDKCSQSRQQNVMNNRRILKIRTIKT